jgi:hypothetical protein
MWPARRRTGGTGLRGRRLANLLAMETPAEKVAGRVFNVACGERHTLNETFRVLADLFQFKEAPVFGPPRTGDIQDSLADISAAREAFEYQPKVSFEEGLYRTVAGIAISTRALVGGTLGKVYTSDQHVHVQFTSRLTSLTRRLLFCT